MSRRVRATAVAAAAGLSLLHGAGLLGALAPATAPALAAGVLLGMLAADLVTGLVHWGCDTWGSERTPWLGPHLIRWFREHHRAPRAMLERDWIEVNGEPALAAGAAFALLLLAPSGLDARADPFAHAFAWALVSFAGLANQTHQWAHGRRPPPLVRWLQRAGVLLSPARHARHHRGRHDAGYCIATGWSNGALDALGFWRRLERCVSLCAGAAPRGSAGGRNPLREGR